MKPDYVKQVQLIDARSWGGAHLIVLASGVNVLVGASDSGKSNFIRSILSLVENGSFPSMAKRGATGVAVGFEFGDHNAVEIKKSAKKNQYSLFDSQKRVTASYDAVGLSVPAVVTQALRMGPVDLGGETVQLNIQSQRGPVLIVDDSPAKVARIIGSVSGLDVLHRAVADAARVKQDADRSAKTLRTIAKEAAAGYREAAGRLDVADADAALARGTAAEAAAGVARERARELTEVRRTASGALAGVAGARRAVDAVRGKETRLAGPAMGLAAVRVRLDGLYRARRDTAAAIAGMAATKAKLKMARAESTAAGQAVKDEWASTDACPLCGRER